jgi:hypothetical protein
MLWWISLCPTRYHQMTCSPLFSAMLSEAFNATIFFFTGRGYLVSKRWMSCDKLLLHTVVQLVCFTEAPPSEQGSRRPWPFYFYLFVLFFQLSNGKTCNRKNMELFIPLSAREYVHELSRTW